MANHIGILSGGAGTRLWPVSRKTYPKQLLDLSGSGRPLIIESIDRLENFGKTHLISTKELEKTSIGICHRYQKAHVNYWSEPKGMNTAPAIACFTQHCLLQDPEAVIAVFPADQHIHGDEEFTQAIEDAFSVAAQGNIVTLGIKPDHPSTAYGYLQTKPSQTAIRDVEKFIEKPHLEQAQELIKNPNMYWNAGIFVFSAQTFLEKLKLHCSPLYQKIRQLKANKENIEEIYNDIPAESIDYALMEKLDSLKCVPGSFQWSDLGSWEQVCHFNKGGEINEINAQNNFYYSFPSSSEKSIFFIGCQNQMLIETQDALLIAQKGAGQEVKKAVEIISQKRPEKANNPTFEERPWGSFEILKDTPYFKSKKITVFPGKKLSYQSHEHRAEHWIIVKGEAEVTIEDQSKKVCAGEHIHIPFKAKHRIANATNEVIEFIEVQYGSYFGEDDIIRYDDDFGRS